MFGNFRYGGDTRAVPEVITFPSFATKIIRPLKIFYKSWYIWIISNIKNTGMDDNSSPDNPPDNQEGNRDECDSGQPSRQGKGNSPRDNPRRQMAKREQNGRSDDERSENEEDQQSESGELSENEVSSDEEVPFKRRKTEKRKRKESSSEAEINDSGKESSSESEMSDSEKENSSEAGISDSDNDSSSEAGMTSDSSSDYEAYEPKKKRGKKWKLQSKLEKYALNKFSRYAKENDIKELLEESPVPSHSFLKAPELDDDIRTGLDAVVGHSQAGYLKKRDSQLWRVNDKITRVMGPLGKLWARLDKSRKKGKEKMKVEEVLDLTEKAVMLIGQANVAVKYQRRMEILKALMKNKMEPKRVLQKYEKLLPKAKLLFGKKFQKQIVKSTKGGEIITWAKTERHARPAGPKRGFQGPRRFQEDHVTRRPFQNERTGRQPFQRGPSRDFRGRRGGNSRGRGGRSDRYVIFYACKSKGQKSGGKTGKRSNTKSSNSAERADKRGKKTSLEGKRSNTKSGNTVKRTDKRGKKTSFEGKNRCAHCGATQTLSSSMAVVDNRLGNSADCGRIEDRVHIGTTDYEDKNSEIQSQDDKTDPKGDKCNENERSNISIQTDKTAVCGTHIPQGEEGWGSETSIQLKTTKPPHQISTFQDGGDPVNERSLAEERLDDQDRLEGRIFLHTNRRTRQEVAQVSMERDNISIQLSPIWTGAGTTEIHKVTETGIEHPQEIRAETSGLPGRLADYGTERSNTTTTRTANIRATEKSGICNKSGKIHDGASTNHPISGLRDPVKSDGNSFASGQSKGSGKQVSTFHLEEIDHSERASSNDRQNDSNIGSNTTSTNTLPTIANVQNKRAPEEQYLRDKSTVDAGVFGGTPMVVPQHERVQWEGYHHNGPRCHADHGCQQLWLGSVDAENQSKRNMGNGGAELAHQCQGVESSRTRDQSTAEGQDKSTCPLSLRQHDNSSTHQQDGGNTFPTVGNHQQTIVRFLLPKQNNPVSRTCSREREYNSGCTVQGQDGEFELETGRGSLQADKSQMGTNHDRLVCGQTERSNQKVCQLASGSLLGSSGCIPNPVARSGICVSAILPDKQVLVQNPTGKNRDNTNHPSLEHATMVRENIRHVHGKPNSTSPDDNNPEITNRGKPPNGGGRNFAISGLENYREELQTAGVSSEAATLLTKSWRQGTRSAYNSAWQKWHSWCEDREMDPIHAPVEIVVEFLKDMLEQGYSYNTINGFRSAISAYHRKVENVPIGQHELVKKMMTAIFNENTPTPKYGQTWSVDQVLTYIKNLGSNISLDDKTLTHKLTMLLALTTAARASELQGLDLQFMKDRGHEIEFEIPKLTKTRRPGQKPQVITVKQFQENNNLDATQCVRDYILRTKNWRQTQTQHKLLLGIVNPHRPVATSTIGNWLKALMTAAGIDTEVFKGHSVRGATTSNVYRQGMPVEEILSWANWSNAGTFFRFYNKKEQSCGALALR
jgi:site-specific recombinase XerD